METLQPTDDQQAALRDALAWIRRGDGEYLVIGGYAGTGKTTLVALLRQALVDEDGPVRKVAFCCYTGKAASVLRRKLAENDSMMPGDSCGTIHSLIYTAETDDGGEILGWKRQPALEADLIVVDEGSMVNDTIWRDLLSYRKPVLVFGDHGQLPPIEGSFNLMEQPHILLSQIVRQAEGNPLIRLSRAVREGKPIPYGSFYGAVHKYHLSDDEARETFEGLAAQKNTDDLIICGMNHTRIRLNRQVRGLRGHEGEMPEKGERVICLKNNHAKTIYNGMVGTVKKMTESGEHWYGAKIEFEDGLGAYKGDILRYQFNQPRALTGELARTMPLPEKEFGDLFDFGYAMTAHKAQGSEARRVILFEERMPRYDDEMWRRWLYTAVTRAKEELFIFA